MKKFLAVVLAVVMMCGVVMAQDMPAGSQAGAKSMNFTFGGLGTFGLAGTGPAGGLGISYFLSSDAAVRLGLQVRSTSSTVPFNPPPATPTATGSDGSTSSFTLGLGADYLMYMSGSASRVKPYMGAGVSFSMGTASSKTAVATGGTATETKGGAGTGITLGLMGIAGAEFYLYNEISISAEYALTLFSLTSPSDLEVTTGATTVKTKSASTTQILGFGAGGATVHIYF